MLMLHGEHKGEHVKVVQFANDWMNVELADGSKSLIVSPTSVEIETKEELSFIQQHQHTGQFWHWFVLSPDSKRFLRTGRKDYAKTPDILVPYQ